MKKTIIIIIALLLISVFSSESLATSYLMHTARQGDTYYRLSNQYGVTTKDMISLNKISYANISVGQLLKVMPLQGNKSIKIHVNGQEIITDAKPYIENNRTFVPIRFVADALGVDEIKWDQNEKTAIIRVGSGEIKLPIGSSIAYVNGMKQSLDAPISLFEDRTFVPLRFVSETLGSKVTWDQESYTVSIMKNDNISIITPAKQSCTLAPEDVYWLSRIIHAEALGESYKGKLAVANVILNRKNSTEFPNTIKTVIFDDKYAIQFTPVKNGRIYNNPSYDSVRAAKEVLSGNVDLGKSLYFVNPVKSPGSWIELNRVFYKKIENHDFYL